MMKRVMTVDDSTTVRQVLSMTLTDAGYEVIEAIDGKDALQKLTEQSINLLVTDLNMPKIDGVSLIKQIRSTEGYRFLPIIMLTTETNPEMKQAGKKAGASGWIAKPFKPEQLLSIVNIICPIK